MQSSHQWSGMCYQEGMLGEDPHDEIIARPSTTQVDIVPLCHETFQMKKIC